jgi:hypothetical protein
MNMRLSPHRVRGLFSRMSTVLEIEQAIEALPLAERLRLYKDMPQLIGRGIEEIDWQRLALEKFFEDDSPDDEVYGGL